MSTFIKIFLGFWAIWIIWYITGGPLRDDKSKPYVGLDKEGNLIQMGTTSLQK